MRNVTAWHALCVCSTRRWRTSGAPRARTQTCRASRRCAPSPLHQQHGPSTPLPWDTYPPLTTPETHPTHTTTPHVTPAPCAHTALTQLRAQTALRSRCGCVSQHEKPACLPSTATESVTFLNRKPRVCVSQYEKSSYEGEGSVAGQPCGLWGVHENKPPKTVEDVVFCVAKSGACCRRCHFSSGPCPRPCPPNVSRPPCPPCVRCHLCLPSTPLRALPANSPPAISRGHPALPFRRPHCWKRTWPACCMSQTTSHCRAAARSAAVGEPDLQRPADPPLRQPARGPSDHFHPLRLGQHKA